MYIKQDKLNLHMSDIPMSQFVTFKMYKIKVSRLSFRFLGGQNFSGRIRNAVGTQADRPVLTQLFHVLSNFHKSYHSNLVYVCTLIDNDMLYHSGQNVLDSRGTA